MKIDICENKLLIEERNCKMMLKAKYLIPVFCLLFIKPGFAQTDINAGISIGPEGLKSFYFSISDYYQVPEPEVVKIRERKILEEELPVVFFIASKAGVKPEVIIDLRLGGSSWYDISVKYGIYADIYYVPLKLDPGPPYRKAYGYYKNKHRKKWKNIRLADEDIINLVNLRFISEYYSYRPEEIVKMRGAGKNYISINKHVKAQKNKHQGQVNGKGKRNKNK
jgi:hypothetical protein